jgi:Gpi18-like mannosyltransferase
MPRAWHIALIAALYALLIPIEAPDFAVYYYPWLGHLQAVGPIAAFHEPFANYSPPYLYLLAAVSLLPVSKLIMVKFLALLALAWLAFAVQRLCLTLGAGDAKAAAIFVLCLPTVIFNGPGLGQCDGFWVAPCLLALASAAERRTAWMAAWAGIAFAFKPQALLLFPLFAVVAIQQKEWRAPFLPPIIYLLAIAPAAIVGWPISDLLLVYGRQAASDFLGNAPNIWAIPLSLGYSGPLPIGYVGAAFAAAAYFLYFLRRELDRDTLLYAALLGALLFPFLLPRMHERYFFLADVLAFVLAYRRQDRQSVAIFVAVQVGSLLSIVGYLWPSPLANNVGSVMIAGALLMLIILAADGGTKSLQRAASRTHEAESSAETARQ